MGENFDISNKGMCELAGKLSLSDVLCPHSDVKANQPAQTTEGTAPTGTHLHDSPFSDRPQVTPALERDTPPYLPQKMPKDSPPQKEALPSIANEGLPAGSWPKPEAQLPSYHPIEKQNQAPAPAPQPTEIRPSNSTAKMPTVYIDIGHCTSSDGKDVDHGFISDTYNECQINKAVGQELIKDLKTDGFRVVPTWNPDSPPPLVSKQADLQRRNNVVNSDIARNGGDSIYVSIHHDDDSSGNSGQCVFVAQPKMSEGMTLARTIQDSAWKVRARAEAPHCINSDTVTQNGKLVGLRGVNTIGVLVEAANVSNPTDKANMTRPEFQRLEASKIAQGVVNYYHLKPGSERPNPLRR